MECVLLNLQGGGNKDFSEPKYNSKISYLTQIVNNTIDQDQLYYLKST
jgi:hypothetical protein